MPTFSSDGTDIHYVVEGEGAPVVLIHGFASDLVRNWKDVGWFKTLNEAGYQVIAMDCRGHGKSGKPYDPVAYEGQSMMKDVINLIDHLGLKSVKLMGYSMGGQISSGVIVNNPDRIEKAVLAGVGGSMLHRSPDRGTLIAEALLSEDPDTIDNPTAKGFREFAEKSGGDLQALATVMSTTRPTYTAEDFSKIDIPVLVVAGEKDDMVGNPADLAAAFPNGELVIVPRRDHLSTTGDKVYKQAVVEFFGR